MRIVAAPDKFKGTASAQEVVAAIAAAAESQGHIVDRVPMADGGEGTLAALGGSNRTSSVTGPLGTPVDAQWRYQRGGLAVIEMAQASGLVLAGGKEDNDPLTATTAGVGELIAEAVDAGATKIIIGVGGSATTDGGLGALEALGSPDRLQGVQITVACDVRTMFVDAATVFGPQKGATPADVAVLTSRLTDLVETYKSTYGVDVSNLPRSGAAGGLAGGLAAIGAELVEGFDVVAKLTGLEEAITGADLVITGEGLLDDESFNGKVVGGVANLAAAKAVPVLAIAGQVTAKNLGQVEAISLTEKFGEEAAMTRTRHCVTKAIAEYLS